MKIKCIIALITVMAIFLCACQKNETPPKEEETDSQISASESPSVEESTSPAPSTAPSEDPSEAPSDEPSEEDEPEEEEDNSYLIKIACHDQSVYSDPSCDSAFVGTVGAAGTYTIVEEATDEDGNRWGKLKSGIGWVNLTEIENIDLSKLYISANYASDDLISSGNYISHGSIGTEEAVTLAFYAYKDLYQFTFTSLEMGEGEYSVGDVLFNTEKFTTEKPFVTDAEFYGSMSAYGISFTDESGEFHQYVVYLSGRNGAVIFEEYKD